MPKKVHAGDVPIAQRIVAFCLILVGFFFYCYNFIVIDYIRPYIIESYGMTLEETALLFTVQSIGILIGTAVTAVLVTHWGNKNVLVVITCLNGLATMANMMFESFIPWAIMRTAVGFSLGGYMTVAVCAMLSLFPPNICGRLMAVCNSMFAVAVVFWGGAASFFGEQSWELTVLLGGAPTLFCGLLMLVLVPDDKKIIAYGEEHFATAASMPKAKWSEMVSGAHAKFTVICLSIAGLNFLGYQAFTGFMTLYLKELDGFEPEKIGMQVALQGVGALFGGLIWGYIADKYGRKVNLIGFFFTAVAVILYLSAGPNPAALGLIVFIYGFMVSCTYSWGVYFTELFPIHLRPMGASLFHGGLVISLFAPSIVAYIAESYGLVTGMLLAPIAFIVGALLWMMLPETLKSSRHYKGFDPNKAEGHCEKVAKTSVA